MSEQPNRSAPPRRMTTPLALAAVAGLAVGAGCGAGVEYTYTPEQPTVMVDGYPATQIPIPPERPQGEVRLASFGVTELAAGDQGALMALHVRLIVTNEGDDIPWTIDTREQLVEIAGEGRSRAVFVNTDLQSLPMVTIGRREKRVLDFYFPLPGTMGDESRLPGFELLWQVTTASRIVAERTMFQRVATVEPPPPQVVMVTGWGPHWWFNPWYPNTLFVHPPVIIVRHPPHHVIIRRPPARPYRAVVHDHRRR
jgi:hypothetical protein